MRRPRDLEKYGSKPEALALLDEIRKLIEAKPDDHLIRLSVDVSYWNESWLEVCAAAARARTARR